MPVLCRASVAFILFAAMLGFAPLTPGGAAAAAEPTRILIVGDSMTQGSTGDYTWRYFVAKALAASATPVDFVGPTRDLYDGPQRPTTLGYADPNFDADHAAQWGTTLAAPKYDWRELGTIYRPQVSVIALGVNDLMTLRESPAVVALRIRQAAATLRAVVPDMKIVLVAPPISTDPQAAGLLAELNAWVAAESRASGSLVLAEPVDLALGSKTAPADTWDGLHPNTRGQIKIATSVTDALARLGIGTPYPRSTPAPPEGLRSAATLTASAAITGANLTWTNPPGATTSRVWMRDASVGAPWSQVGEWVSTGSFDLVGLEAGHTYEFRVQSVKVWVPAADTYSNVVSVVPTSLVPPAAPVPAPAPVAVPVVVPPPAAPAPVAPVAAAAPVVRVTCGRRTPCRASWASVPGATAYQVAYHLGDGKWRESPAQPTTTWSLPRGVRAAASKLRLRVRSWTAATPGAWSSVVRPRTRSAG